MSKYNFFVIKGSWSWWQLSQILKGEDTYSPNKNPIMTDKANYPKGASSCGLSLNVPVTYKIYTDHKEGKYNGIRSAHVCLHSDGVCFSGSLAVNCDWDLARELHDKVRIYIERSLISHYSAYTEA